MDTNKIFLLKERINGDIASIECKIKEALELIDYADADINELSMDEITFENTAQQRHFENLVQTRNVQVVLLETIDDMLASANDDKKRHRTAKAIEENVHFVRQLKHESEQVIYNEQQMLQSTNDILAVLDTMRNSFS